MFIGSRIKECRSQFILFREMKVYSESSLLKEDACFMYWSLLKLNKKRVDSNDKRVDFVPPVNWIHILQFEPILDEQSSVPGKV